MNKSEMIMIGVEICEEGNSGMNCCYWNLDGGCQAGDTGPHALDCNAVLV